MDPGTRSRLHHGFAASFGALRTHSVMQILPTETAVSNQKKIFLKSRRKVREKFAFPASAVPVFLFIRARLFRRPAVQNLSMSAHPDLRNSMLLILPLIGWHGFLQSCEQRFDITP